MTWDNVPWFVGGGAEHSPEVARLLAYAATSGAEGIVTPGDLKVVPLDVPGSSVRVLPGAGLMLNNAQGGSQQTYVGRLATADTVSIAATGSGGGRSDLIIAEIMDPFVAGSPYQTPADVKAGPYIRTRVISNVAAGTSHVPAGITGLPLARIDLPASTGTVTAAMITDVRYLAQPRSSNIANSMPLSEYLNATDTVAWKRWPNPSIPVRVPTWANWMTVKVDFSGILRDSGALGIGLSVVLGDFYTGIETAVMYDAAPTPGLNGRESFFVTATAGIPADRRGTVQDIYTQARRMDPATYPGYLRSAEGGQINWDVRFYEYTV